MDPLLAAKHLRVPSIVHARELVSHDEGLAAQFGENPSAIVRSVRGASDFIIANSATTHLLYRRGSRSFRLYNSVALDHFDLPNLPEPGKLRVGIVSSNQLKKGIEHFVNLAAMAARPRSDLEFVVIGPRTEYADRLEQRARNEDIR